MAEVKIEYSGADALNLEQGSLYVLRDDEGNTEVGWYSRALHAFFNQDDGDIDWQPTHAEPLDEAEGQ